MKDIREVNFDDLIRGYWDKATERGAKCLDKHDDKSDDLFDLLRHHETRTIEHEETYIRDAIDSLLGFYSLLEVARVAEFVSWPLPSAFAKRASHHLGLKAVRRFYEKHYKQVLVTQFRRRLSGHEVFMQFLDMSNILRDDSDIDALLTLLDDYIIDDISWADLEKVIRDPKRYIEVMSAPTRKQTYLHEAARGYHKFLLFCQEFDGFLTTSERFPFFCSCCWNYHSYWFKHLEDRIDPAIRQSLNRILSLVEHSEKADVTKSTDRRPDLVISMANELQQSTATVAAVDKLRSVSHNLAGTKPKHRSGNPGAIHYKTLLNKVAREIGVGISKAQLVNADKLLRKRSRNRPITTRDIADAKLAMSSVAKPRRNSGERK
jgi:hypothetical protein